MVFVSRRGTASTGRFLEWKIGLFFLGAVLLLLGIGLGKDVLALLSIVVLAVAVLLRFLERPGPPEGEGEAAEPLELGDPDAR